MSCSGNGPGCVAFTYNAATNQITTPGYGYGPRGNQDDPTYSYGWGDEGRMLTAVSNATQALVATYTYNALMQRVRDVTQTETTDEVYGAGGALLWRYTGNSSSPDQRAYVPFNGGILAEYWSGGTLFDHPDELGSISTSTDNTGNNLAERFFYPYGELWTGIDLNGFNPHRTYAKQPDYDPEIDMYNDPHRHYMPSGRFPSPDPGGISSATLSDPQTWNRYAYARNNPTTLTDPSGLMAITGANMGVGEESAIDAARLQFWSHGAGNGYETTNSHSEEEKKAAAKPQVTPAQAQNKHPNHHPKHPKPKSAPLPSSGVASIYSDYFNGKPTRSGEIFSQGEYTGALLPKARWDAVPMRTKVEIMHDGRALIIEINDVGKGNPDQMERVLDLSRADASALLDVGIENDKQSNAIGLIRLDAIEVVPCDTPLGPLPGPPQ